MTQTEYEQKKRDFWEVFKKQNLDGEVQWQPVSRYEVFLRRFRPRLRPRQVTGKLRVS